MFQVTQQRIRGRTRPCGDASTRPVRGAPAAPPDSVRGTVGLDGAFGQPRVVLVDDDARMRAILRELLEDDQLCVVVDEADNAETALPMIRAAAADGPLVALMDVRMPGRFNGIDLTRQVTSLGIPVEVVVCTGFPDVEASAWNAGAAGFLVKGASATEIIAAVEAAWSAVQRRS